MVIMEAADQTLLDRYLSKGDDEAFHILVSRYMDFVHGVARRITENDDLARDVAQLTFIRLARRAALIPPNITLAAWLHRICRCFAVDQVRAESRRKKRELVGFNQPLSMDPTTTPCDWTALAPVVDELISRLPAADRDILLLRYYRNQSHAKVAARLGLTESIARQRAYRAIEKLRVLLAKRGITTSSVALATILPAHAAPAAPASLTSSVFDAVEGITPVASNFITSTLIAVTTTQKAALVSSLLLLFSAAGYTLATDGSSLGATAAAATSQSPASRWRFADRPRSDHRRIRPVPATAEDRLERLKEIIAIPNRVELQTQMIAYLDGLPPNLFGETATILRDLREDYTEIPIALTISAWAKVDQREALRFATDPENHLKDEIAGNIVAEWCGSDPKAALAWALQSSDPELYTGDVVWGVARNKPENVGKLILDLSDGPAKWTAFEKLVQHLKDEGNDPEFLQKIIAGVTESQRAVLYGNLSQALYETPEKAVEILKEHPEAIPFASSGYIYTMWGSRDNAAAAASMESLPPGEMKKEALEGVLRGAVNSDPPKAIDLMKHYSREVSDAYRSYTLKSIGVTYPIPALEQLPEIHDEELKNKTVVEILNPWLLKNPSDARNWLQSNPQPPSVWNRLEQ